MIQKKLTIINRLGLHARAASKLVETAQAFSSNISISEGDSNANGKSIMSLLILAAPCNSILTITIEGEDEADAMNALVTLINNRFDEAE
jgi:phosphocarrier protein